MNLRMQASFPYFRGHINLEAYKSLSEVKEVNTLVAQFCLTLCDPMDCSLPDPSVHGILQARILEWVAMPSSRGSSLPRSQTWVSCIAGRFFTTELPEKTPKSLYLSLNLKSSKPLPALPYLHAGVLT